MKEAKHIFHICQSICQSLLKKLINTPHDKSFVSRRRRSGIRPELIISSHISGSQIAVQAVAVVIVVVVIVVAAIAQAVQTAQVRQVPDRPHKRCSQELRRTGREQRRQTLRPIPRCKGLLFPRGLHVAGTRALRAIRWFCGVVHLTKRQRTWGQTAFMREGFGESGMAGETRAVAAAGRRRNRVWRGQGSRRWLGDDLARPVI